MIGNAASPDDFKNSVCNESITDSGSYNCVAPITGKYVFFIVNFILAQPASI